MSEPTEAHPDIHVRILRHLRDRLDGMVPDPINQALIEIVKQHEPITDGDWTVYCRYCRAGRGGLWPCDVLAHTAQRLGVQ